MDEAEVERVLRPALWIVGRRQYRQNTLTDGAQPGTSAVFGAPDGEVTENLSSPVQSEPSSCQQQHTHRQHRQNASVQEEQPIQAVDKGDTVQFMTKMTVASCFVGKIIGQGGRNKQHLERETGATIDIPKRGRSGRHHDGSSVDPSVTTITITGTSEDAVDSARTRIRLALDAAAGRHAPTHFVCLPLLGKAVADGVLRFRREALAKFADAKGMAPELFTGPATLHLTLAVLKLFTLKQKQQALDVIQTAAKNLAPKIKGNKLKIHLRGIDYMSDDPSQVNVLYAKVAAEDAALQEMADHISKALFQAGLSQHDTPVKLHATVMNTKWRSGQKQQSNRLPFDARGLLGEFKDFDFGTVEVQEYHLSAMSREKPLGPDGFYHSEARVSLSGSVLQHVLP